MNRSKRTMKKMKRNKNLSYNYQWSKSLTYWSKDCPKRPRQGNWTLKATTLKSLIVTWALKWPNLIWRHHLTTFRASIWWAVCHGLMRLIHRAFGSETRKSSNFQSWILHWWRRNSLKMSKKRMRILQTFHNRWSKPNSRTLARVRRERNLKTARTHLLASLYYYQVLIGSGKEEKKINRTFREWICTVIHRNCSKTNKKRRNLHTRRQIWTH